MKWFNFANAILFVALATGAANAQWYEAAATDETNPLAGPTLAPATETDGGSYGPGTPPMPADAGHASPSPSDLGPIRLPAVHPAGAPPAAATTPTPAPSHSPALGAPAIAPPIGAPPAAGDFNPQPTPAAVMPGIAPLAAPQVTPAPSQGFVTNVPATAGPIINNVNSQYHQIPFGDLCPTYPNPCNTGLWDTYCADKKYWCQRKDCARPARRPCPAPTHCGSYAPRGPKPCGVGCGSPCGNACAAPCGSPCGAGCGAACGSSLFSGFKLPSLNFSGCNPWTRGGCGAPACAAPAPCAPVCGPAPCAPAPCGGQCGFRGKYGSTSCGPCGGCGNACGAVGCGSSFGGLSLFKGLGLGGGCGAKQSCDAQGGCHANSGCCGKSLNSFSGWFGAGFGRRGYHYADHAPIHNGGCCDTGCCDGGYDHHAAQLDLHNGPGVYRGGTAGYDQSPGSHAMPTILPPAQKAPKLAPQPVPAPVSKGARRPFFNLNRGF